MLHHFYLSDLGIISALGTSHQQVFENMIAADLSNVVWRDDFLPQQKQIKLASVLAPLPMIKNMPAQYQIRCNQMLLAAYLQIENSVDLAVRKFGKNRIAVVIGGSTSGINEGQSAIKKHNTNGKFPDDFSCAYLEMGNSAKFLAEFLGLKNISYAVSTACSSGAKAFLSAQNLLEMDLCDAVLVGGCDSLCGLTVNGFHALELVSEDISNPFSANRCGITIGEGAALFLLTKERSEIRLMSVGESSDAYHNVSPDPQGLGAISSMRIALEKAQIEPHQVDYINLHGTGTRLNDQMESVAVNSIFGDKTKCSSTKPLTGHTLGSSGIIEIGLCWLLLKQNDVIHKLPPHLWDSVFDVDLPKLNFVRKNEVIDRLQICLSNSFAFGGSNASVLIGKNV